MLRLWEISLCLLEALGLASSKPCTALEFSKCPVRKPVLYLGCLRFSMCPITKNLVIFFPPVEPFCMDQIQNLFQTQNQQMPPGEKMARPSVHLRKTSSSEIQIQSLLLPVFWCLKIFWHFKSLFFLVVAAVSCCCDLVYPTHQLL